jgi:hypothetical protein
MGGLRRERGQNALKEANEQTWESSCTTRPNSLHFRELKEGPLQNSTVISLPAHFRQDLGNTSLCQRHCRDV